MLLLERNFHVKCEDGNRVDPFAVAVVRSDSVIGHVPRKISSICSLYLRQDGLIVCCVTGTRRFSVDLAQGGLEISCVLIFQGDAKHTAKAKKLVESVLATTTTILSASKKRQQSNVPTGLFTASLASLIAAGLTYADKGPLGFGRAPEGWKYQYNAIALSPRFHVGDRPFKI